MFWQGGQSSSWQCWAGSSAAGGAPCGLWGERRAREGCGAGWGARAPMGGRRIWSQTDSVTTVCFVGVWWEQGEKRSTGLVGSQQLWEGCDCDWGSMWVLSAPEASLHSCPEYGEEKAVSGKADGQG